MEQREQVNNDHFHDYFLFKSSIHNYATKQSGRHDLLLVKRRTCKYGLHSIRYLEVKLLKELPVGIKNVPTKFNLKIN